MSEPTETQTQDFNEETSNEIEPLDEVPEKSDLAKPWAELKFIPNKRRFTILASVGTFLELGILFIFAYAFPNSREIGLNILGLMLVPPFIGLLISYFVQDKKEGVGVSSVNAVTSIIPFMIVHSLIELFVYDVESFGLWYFLFPFLGMAFQVMAAYTMSRVRNLFKMYGDPNVQREGDEAMIAELRESRIERGLEEPVTEEVEEVMEEASEADEPAQTESR